MKTNKKFKVKIYPVVLSVDIQHNTQYVLSTNKDEICFPFIELNNLILNDGGIEKNIIKHLQNFIFTNELELLPQLICINSEYINNSDDNEINIVYGFVIDYNKNINNSHWIPFDYLNSNKYSNLLFEIIQKLR